MKKGKLSKRNSFTEKFENGSITTIFKKDGSVIERVRIGKKVTVKTA